jgi:hypothetical protein
MKKWNIIRTKTQIIFWVDTQTLCSIKINHTILLDILSLISIVHLSLHKLIHEHKKIIFFRSNKVTINVTKYVILIFLNSHNDKFRVNNWSFQYLARIFQIIWIRYWNRSQSIKFFRLRNRLILTATGWVLCHCFVCGRWIPCRRRSAAGRWSEQWSFHLWTSWSLSSCTCSHANMPCRYVVITITNSIQNIYLTHSIEMYYR